MLNRLKVENFKAWREADLAFGRVTGFFGTNSAGKSSLLHLLLLLKQTRNATDRGIVLDFGGSVRHGEHGHVRRRGSPNMTRGHEISWLLEWALPEDADDRRSVRPFCRTFVPGGAASRRVVRGGFTKQEPVASSSCPIALLKRGLSSCDLPLKSEAASSSSQPTAVEFSFVRNQGRPWPASPPEQKLPFSRPGKKLFSERGLPWGLRAGLREPDGLHLLSGTVARISAAGVPLGRIEPGGRWPAR